jgi:glutamyl-Q tRNA(Asp) synthetase
MMADSASSLIQYRGRFAPSPTGPLHFGSLVSAVASYLQAKANDGQWLVRIEDLDPPRELLGCSDDILRTLEHHGLSWDESILYQSQRTDHYISMMEQLDQQQLLYHCHCSRKSIIKTQQALGISVYPGTCRDQPSDLNQASTVRASVRIRTDDRQLSFVDQLQGHFQQNLAHDVGDFILRRSDGWIAYQLAVVVDDAFQQITEVVRGSDLLDNTPRQILLQKYLGLPTPDYAHHPVATNLEGDKLSKQTFAKAIVQTTPTENIIKALDFLGQNPPDALEFSILDDLWYWAISHWDLKSVPHVMKVAIVN